MQHGGNSPEPAQGKEKQGTMAAAEKQDLEHD
jgi:hypothetical protein